MIYEWENRKCMGMDINWFFDDYEEDSSLAKLVDKLCNSCQWQNQCLASGISNQEWGVWGGVYLENGKISKPFNRHKTSDAWFDIWMSATTE